MDDFENRASVPGEAGEGKEPRAENNYADSFFSRIETPQPADKAEADVPTEGESAAAVETAAEHSEGENASHSGDTETNAANAAPQAEEGSAQNAQPRNAYQGYQHNQGYQPGGSYQEPPYGGCRRPPYPQNGGQNPYYGAPYGGQTYYGTYQPGGYRPGGYGYQSGGYGYQQGGYAPGGSRQNDFTAEEPQNRAEPGNPNLVAEPEDNADKGGKGKKIFFALIAIVLVAAIVGGSVMMKNYVSKSRNSGSGLKTADNETEEEASSAVNDVSIAINPVNEDSKALTTDKIAEKARESCVGVLVYAANTGVSTNNEAGQGTGIIAQEDAKEKCTYILTCAHVIDEGNVSVKIQLENGTVYDAEIVAYDVRTDVGVVKVNQTGLKTAEFGDDTQLKVGSAVYAVGNPGGVEFFGSFTDGIVSAIDRPIDSEIGYTMKCIQHTAAINPGNSGGALVNVYGQVIGINSQKIASTDYEGMGFAIPITQALDIARDLINYKYVPDRAKLGITYYSLSADRQYSMIAQINQLPAGTLIIKSISEDSSLANTKAQEYDMIIAVNGKELTTADILLEKIDKGHVGDKLKLTLCRVNSNYTLEKFDVEVTLVEDKGDTPVETTTAFSFYPFGDEFNFGN